MRSHFDLTSVVIMWRNLRSRVWRSGWQILLLETTLLWGWLLGSCSCTNRTTMRPSNTRMPGAPWNCMFYICFFYILFTTFKFMYFVSATSNLLAIYVSFAFDFNELFRYWYPFCFQALVKTMLPSRLPWKFSFQNAAACTFLPAYVATRNLGSRDWECICDNTVLNLLFSGIISENHIAEIMW